MNGSAKKAVGGMRPWTSRATHRKPDRRQRRDREDDQLHRGLEPESGASSSTSRSTPRLPIAAQ